MTIDIHTHIGQSIYGYGQRPHELIARMDRLAIERAVVCPVQPIDYHLEPANDEVAAAVNEHPDRLLGFCRVDPRRGERAVEELRRAVSQLGLSGLFLHPWEEGYSVNDEKVVRVVGVAGELGVPVMIAAGYPWYSHPLQVADLARRFPRQKFLMTHGGQLNISGLAQQDAMTALSECPNILIEVSGVYRQDFIEGVVQGLGGERVLFGSNSPQMHQEFELERIHSVKVTAQARERILAYNARELLDIPD
ncbi:MAG: amidohydrolase family protein [Trueperaceae bacterium]